MPKQIMATTDNINEWEMNLPANIEQAKKLLMESYVNAWREDIQDKLKLTLYKQLKNDWIAEGYVKVSLEKGKQSLICQLRCGTLGLSVETGRYHKIPRNLRICNLCEVEVEDEIHFLFTCEKLQSCRLAMYHKIPEILNHSNPNDKLSFLMKKPYILGNYVYSLWQE